jgi:hypothetical protein
MAAYGSAGWLARVSLVAIALLAWSGVDSKRASSQEEGCNDAGYATDHVLVR